METITYLLGAGASAECLPVVNEMSKSIKDLQERYRGQYRIHSNKNNPVYRKIDDDLDWLITICNSHSSVDTYAKKLFLDHDDQQYIRLKNALSIYFTLAQKFPAEWQSGVYFDKRYDNFWASILNRDKPAPENIKILSWNYDSQLELSYSTFFKDEMKLAYNKLNMLSFHDDVRNFQKNKFAIFKLNGSAKLISEFGYKSSYLTTKLIDNDHGLFFDEIFKNYKIINDDGPKIPNEATKSQLSFAWEHDEKTNDYYRTVRESISSTSVLVVIGYSFPFFNRAIDKKLINEYMPMLRKVYFQSIQPENLKERFLAITDRIGEDKLLLRYDRAQFAFPNELDI